MKRLFAILLTIAIIITAVPAVPVFAGAKPNWLTDPNSVFANDTSPKVAHVYMQNEPGYEDWSFDCSEKELDFVGTYAQMEYDNKNASWVRLRSIDITLYADCTTKYFPRCRNWDLNINLNGHTWTTSENRPTFEVTNYKSITISNGTLTFTGTPDYPIYSCGGKVTISNVLFKDCVCNRYGLIALESHGSIEQSTTVAVPSEGVIDQRPDEKTAKTNGALHLKNVRFENCTSSSYGACVYVNSDQKNPMTFDHCQFINCSSQYGGALYFESDDNIYNFTNCEFVNCAATTDGGAIYCESEDSQLCFTNCNAYGCHAGDCGGFVFLSGERTVYNGAGNAAVSTIGERSNVIGCYALDSGGAFYSSVNTSCSNYSEIRNFNMAYNTAGADKHNFDAVKANDFNSWGGAVCFRGTDMKLCYCDLYSNYAPYYGGAVYCGYRRTAVENCTFYENRCSEEYGNDIYLDSASQYVTGCTFYTNGNSVAGSDPERWENNAVTSIGKEDLFSGSQIEDGDYILYTALDERYAVEISGGKAAVNVSGANVHLWENGDAEVFTITKDKAKGTYIIQSKVTGLVLDVSNASKENGANIQQWGSNGTDAQRWVFEQADNGNYYIRCAGGQYMDASGMVNGAKPTNDVNIQSWSFTGAPNQQFKLVKVSGETKTAVASGETTGNGSKENPYKILNADQWKAFALNVLLGETYAGKYFELTNDISISYMPVGYFNQRKAFQGNLDGKNHTIHYLDSSENWDRGLFSYCKDATIKNLRVTGEINGTVTLAGICAAAENTTFENCISDVNITSFNDRNIAGICGIANKCKFVNCINNGELRGGSAVSGGIAALAEGGESELTGCRNNGSVSVSNENAGGMIGEATVNVKVKRCTNNAPVGSGNMTAAGMVGCLRKGADIISCINTEKGVISAGQYAAGMIGWTGPSNESVNIKNCANSGEIKARVSDCAGIAVNLDNDKMTVVNCFNGTTKIANPASGSIEIAEGDYVIDSVLDEKYSVEISGGKAAVNVSGANVHLWENGEAEVFTITKDKAKGTYIIQSKVTGLVLDVSNASKEDGANIQQWESNGTDAQRWVFESAGNGAFYIRCVGGRYMDASGMVNGAKPTNDVNIQSWTFTGADNQKFKLTKVNEIAEGDYIIYTALNEKLALDIEGGKTAENIWGRNLFLWENGEANVFTVTKDTERNAYSIRSRVTGLMLDVVNGSMENGANIQQWEDNGLDPQRWVFEDAGNGYYYIRCLGGQYMDVAGFNAVSGGNIHSWAFTGADNQKFKLVNVAGRSAGTAGAILSANSKGAYTNCYYLNGGIRDDHATAFSLADCGETLRTNMNLYIAKNVASKEIADWSLWQTNAATGIAMPDLENVYAKNIKGEGTLAKPFLISSSKGLKELARNIDLGIDYTGMYFRLTENIAYTGAPVGSQGKPFTGIFDGNGHMVTIHMGGQNNTALFGELRGAAVKNLRVSGSIQGGGSTAAIAGSATNSRIDNCLVTAAVTGTDANVGGIVGLLDNCTVSNCRMEGTVKNTGTTSTGGIVGGAITSGRLINCVCTGKVTGDKAVGGLIGCVMYGDPMIVNCASVGSTAENSTGSGYEHGGFVGFINSGINTMTISNSFSCCAVGIKKDSGLIAGNNQKAETVSTDHLYYKKAGSTSNTLGTGKQLNDDVEAPITRLSFLYDSSADKLTANTMDKDTKVIKETDGIKLTPWAKESSFLAPSSYAEISFFVASVFSSQSLPMLIVIGIGLAAGIVGVTVMYRKKRKNSGTDGKQKAEN